MPYGWLGAKAIVTAMEETVIRGLHYKTGTDASDCELLAWLEFACLVASVLQALVLSARRACLHPQGLRPLVLAP